METAKEFQKLCKGLQHVGIPTADLQKTLAFYESLGFEKAYLAGSVEGGRAVAFYRLGDLTMEIYGGGCLRRHRPHRPGCVRYRSGLRSGAGAGLSRGEPGDRVHECVGKRRALLYHSGPQPRESGV